MKARARSISLPADSRLPRRQSSRALAGFTLIEMIATLVLSGILVALLLPLIGSSLTSSSDPLLRSPATYSLRSHMETCWQLYRSPAGDDLTTLSIAIGNAATADGFTAASAWVLFNPAGQELPSNAGNPENVLRVTLTNNQGDRLTAYFSPRP